MLLGMVLLVAFSACNNTGEIKVETDSLKSKVDTLLNSVGNSKVIDSIEAKGKRLLDSIRINTNDFMDADSGTKN